MAKGKKKAGSPDATTTQATGDAARLRLDDAPVNALAARTLNLQPRASYVPVAKQRETVRTVLALGLLATIVLLSLGYSSALLAGAVSASDVTRLLAGIFTPVLGVFGAVTGFYYGSHASDASRG